MSMSEAKLDPRFPSPLQRELAEQRRERQARFDAAAFKALPAPPKPGPEIAEPPVRKPRLLLTRPKIGAERQDIFRSLPDAIRETRDLADFFVETLMKAHLRWWHITTAGGDSHVVENRRALVRFVRAETTWTLAKIGRIFERSHVGIFYQLRDGEALKKHLASKRESTLRARVKARKAAAK